MSNTVRQIILSTFFYCLQSNFLKSSNLGALEKEEVRIREVNWYQQLIDH
jgi:hypothetical protein